MAAHANDPRQNDFLASMPASVWAQLSKYLEFVEMEPGDVLYESGRELKYFYFPTTSIVSLLYAMEDGAAPEIAVVGKEGVIGVALYSDGDGDGNPIRAEVQCGGQGYRIRARYIAEAADQSAELLQLLLNYTKSVMRQMVHTAVANGYHSIEQRLCRRLLLGLDRLQSNQIAMTHEVIASVLGVRREGVTEAARKLQSAGLIEYSRGKITVIDRRGLEARARGCYHGHVEQYA